MEHTPLSLYELNALVRQSVRLSMPDAYWVQAELSDVRTNYSGHCYLEFVQKDPKSNALLAKARGIVWSNVFRELKPYFERETGQAFVAGLKVLVRVTVDFHELYGYSLTNKELELPELTQRIAVISSPTAAGYGDFCDQLERNAFGFVFYTKLFPAVMQGEQVEDSIIRALNRINAGHGRWDVVVIIRGGGATSDLSGFDTYELATNCAQFPIPIITGIGHERDDTVIDKVAHTRVKTPTAAAEFLINHLRETADRLEAYASFFYQEVPSWLGEQKERLDRFVARIPARVQMRIQNEGFRQERLVKRVHLAWQARMMRETYRLQLDGRLNVALQSRLQREGGRLQLLEQQVRAASPELLLQKGYSITLKNGKAVTDASALHPGDEVVTRVAKGEFKSKVL